MEADFSGYATKAGLRCTDGRTIMPEAFKHMDGKQVPLVWQHGHSEPSNVLGHALLEAREDGVYAYGFFNDSSSAQNAKTLVEHKDVNALSIYANQLIERTKSVFHGVIKEVSLVLSGANPGALIDNIRIAHADGDVETLDEEAIIYTGLELQHSDSDNVKDENDDDVVVQDILDSFTDEQKQFVQHMLDAALEEGSDSELAQADEADAGDQTVEDVYNSLTEVQKNVVHYMIGAALEAAEDDDAVAQSDDDTNEGDLNHQEMEGTDMTRNVFEQQAGGSAPKATLSHAQIQTIVADAQKSGSFKESFLAHAVEYGIEDIDILFPDARTITNGPELISRRMEWVNAVISGAHKSPFSRIKSISADITLDTARAKGYVKGSMKKDEWFGLASRVTTPTTIYKKQKLDRDDIVDITDLDIVAWLKGEMRLMLDEEIARAVLVGDGREIDDEDKINESNIRSIAFDDDFYTHKVVINSATVDDAVVEAILRARPFYRGTGSPTLFLTTGMLVDLLLIKDDIGRRLYSTQNDLAVALQVKDIVTVEVLENLQGTGGDILAVMVNMSDYTMGADRGGNISMFDDFDIDYNQYKYLIETRMSGCLTKFKSAVVFTRGGGTAGASEVSVIPGVPTFVSGTGVVTVPATANVVYKNGATGATLTAGAQAALASGESIEVVATPATGYYFPHNTDDDWTFTRP